VQRPDAEFERIAEEERIDKHKRNVQDIKQEMRDYEKPLHYMLMDGKFECKDLIRDRVESATDISKHSSIHYANAIKYLMRCFHKDNTKLDLKKTIVCIGFLLGELDD